MSIKVEFIESYIKPDGSGDYIWHDNHGEFIRCKDCIHAKEITQYGCSECVRHCEKLKIVTSPDWFCAEGRRKDEGGPD